MNRKRRILYVFAQAIDGNEVLAILGPLPAGRLLRVCNQKIPIEDSGKPTELFGEPQWSEPGKTWIYEENT